MKHRIHINKSIIASNAKHGENKPAITTKNYRENRYGYRADIHDKEGNVVASVIQADGEKVKPLSCGARVWIETESEVTVVDEL